MARDADLLTIPAGDNTVRLLPPLVITEDELDEGVRRIDAACKAAEAKLAAARRRGLSIS